MAEITQKKLVSQLQKLKEIKPRQEWVSLIKSTLLENKVPSRMTGSSSAQSISFMETLKSVFFQRKLAYSLATLAIMIVGVFGFVKYETNVSVQKLVQQSQANLTSKLKISQDVASLKNKISNLKVNDSAGLKEIAGSLKTLASVSETDLTADKGVKDLYETIVASQISDLKKSTLTDEQEKILTKVEELYSQGKYADALEQILLINQ